MCGKRCNIVVLLESFDEHRLLDKGEMMSVKNFFFISVLLKIITHFNYRF